MPIVRCEEYEEGVCPENCPCITCATECVDEDGNHHDCGWDCPLNPPKITDYLPEDVLEAQKEAEQLINKHSPSVLMYIVQQITSSPKMHSLIAGKEEEGLK